MDPETRKAFGGPGHDRKTPCISTAEILTQNFPRYLVPPNKPLDVFFNWEKPMPSNAPRAYNRIRELRTIVGLTQRELALATGVAFPTLARLDAHRSAMPSVEVAILLARAFGVDVPSLITEKL